MISQERFVMLTAGNFCNAFEQKISGRDRKCCDIGGIGLAKLIIKREKSMMGAALAMNCYDGDTLLCRVKNGKEEICYCLLYTSIR